MAARQGEDVFSRPTRGARQFGTPTLVGRRPSTHPPRRIRSGWPSFVGSPQIPRWGALRESSLVGWLLLPEKERRRKCYKLVPGGRGAFCSD